MAKGVIHQNAVVPLTIAGTALRTTKMLLHRTHHIQAGAIDVKAEKVALRITHTRHHRALRTPHHIRVVDFDMVVETVEAGVLDVAGTAAAHLAAVAV